MRPVDALDRWPGRAVAGAPPPGLLEANPELGLDVDEDLELAELVDAELPFGSEPPELRACWGGP